MAAGQGFKTFTTGEVLTAGDVNGYLMQGINVFASTAARDAAITSPQEGQFAFTKDTNGLWYYDGAAWVASGATGDIEGVTAGVGISGGGTSGTVTITNSMATAIDAKGDLVAGTGADAFSRIAVGTNGQVLKANSATATGLEWGSAGAALSWSLISTTSMSGSSTVTLSGLNYKNLRLFVDNATSATSNVTFSVRPNGTASNHVQVSQVIASPSSYSANSIYGTYQTSSGIGLCSTGSTTASAISGYVNFSSADQTTGFKPYEAQGFPAFASGATDRIMQTTTGFFTATVAITSIDVLTSGGTFNAGTLRLYGAN